MQQNYTPAERNMWTFGLFCLKPRVFSYNYNYSVQFQACPLFFEKKWSNSKLFTKKCLQLMCKLRVSLYAAPYYSNYVIYSNKL